MTMKKSIIMFTSLLLVALFIGTSMNSAIAADIREVVEDECTLCASNEGSESLEGTSSGGECDPCQDMIDDAFDAGETEMRDAMPDPLEKPYNVLELFEYILDVRDAIGLGLVVVFWEIGSAFAPYILEITGVGMGTFLTEWLENGNHPSTALGYVIIAMVDRLVEICEELQNGGSTQQSAPATAPVSEPVTAPVSEPATAPVSEPATAPVSEPATAPVSEPATAPVSEPATAPVSEPATAPVSEPATAPVSEPATAPVSEPVATRTFAR